MGNDHECTKCHGVEGRGKSDEDMMLDGVSERLTEAEVRQWITDPRTMTAQLETRPKVAMKPTKLSDSEIDAVVAYLLSLEPR